MAERRYPASEVRGGDERCYPTSRPGAAAGRSSHTPEARRGGQEDLYLESKSESCSTLCNPIDIVHGIRDQNIGVGSLSLLKGIFPTQGANNS